ncbi:MAG: hypothetical protein H6624_15935 [Bdellovibrionaceae bacterium]|nr:hypothetical protein [Bdellovibrionales bacterium]MCB9085838.1 hypothetical protein [Pseudobdellovibrionaceae bacterium]
MKSRPLVQCKKNWDFTPLKLWPKRLPPYCWEEEVLTGFDQSEGNAVDLSEGNSPLEVFQLCYPVLSLAELARLWSLVKNDPRWGHSIEALFRRYGYRWNDELEKTCHYLVTLPMSFQNWCSEKQLSPRDLAPVRALPQPKLENGLWECLAKSRLSKSQGVQALEWAVDLLLMDSRWSELAPMPGESDNQWLERLKALRFPHTQSRDCEKQIQMSRLPWPSRTQGQWIRQGDKGLLDVRFHADSLEDFHNKLEGLAKVEKALAKDGLLWNK